MDSYDLLARPIQKWVRHQGWEELRLIQTEAIKTIMHSGGKEDQVSVQDVIIAAETAGGKTEAAFLPLLSQIIRPEGIYSGSFDLLYVSPLKALINDQYGRLQSICRETEIAITPWHGDVAKSKKDSAIDRPSGVLLITPESLEALFITRARFIPRLFNNLQAIVIDELHTFLDIERGVHLRSLLARLELALSSRRIRRIGLSATLGDIELAKQYLRPNDSENIAIVEAESNRAEIRLQLRGYQGEQTDGFAKDTRIAEHIFKTLRGKSNLVFAGRRQTVEVYADDLRRITEKRGLPEEFFPHHGNLSKEVREFVEEKLKQEGQPATAICTSTLELGIDIGEVDTIAQIGAPFTVSSLRQRLGRSGRRVGEPSILRQYAVERRISGKAGLVDLLRVKLVRSIAMIELMLRRWCEPPKPQSLHLSTLVHQILSVVAERGGERAKNLYETLCEKGPFTNVSTELFIKVLRQLGHKDVCLLEQAADGHLLLGKVGEKLVEHYSFFAVFKTPVEYRVTVDGRELGTLPLNNVMATGVTIIFAGRRWEVVDVDSDKKEISVKPSDAGAAVSFEGDPGDVHDNVITEMRSIYLGEIVPRYLDDEAKLLLSQGRATFFGNRLDSRRIIETGSNKAFIATWAGTTKTWSLGLVFGTYNYGWTPHDGFLEVSGAGADRSVWDVLRNIRRGVGIDFSDKSLNLSFEKFHPYLSRDLLLTDAKSSRLDLKSLPNLVKGIIGAG